MIADCRLQIAECGLLIGGKSEIRNSQSEIFLEG
jgi:hypothetical protein